ncbi:MAG: hypothetical protein ABSF80_07115 [Chitinispirillaceae bacterium]
MSILTVSLARLADVESCTGHRIPTPFPALPENVNPLSRTS